MKRHEALSNDALAATVNRLQGRLLVPMFCLLLVSCSDPRDITEAKIRPALQAYISELSNSQTAYCPTVSWPDARFVRDHEFVKRGWAKVQRDCPPQTSFLPPICVLRFVYTPAGEDALLKRVEGLKKYENSKVCFATPELAEIEEWTPAAQVFDDTVTTVKFSYRPTNIKPWAREFASDPVLRSYFELPFPIDSPTTTRTTLRLTNKGWTISK